MSLRAVQSWVAGARPVPEWAARMLRAMERDPTLSEWLATGGII